MNKVQQFYDEMYKKNKKQFKPGGILGWLFLKLRRFELHRIILAYRLMNPEKRFLDLGMGNGDLMKIAQGTKFQEVYGVDISKKNLKYTQKNLSGKLPNKKWFIKWADIDDKIPYPNNYFDTITALAVLEHIFDPYHVIKEIRRVLKQDGFLIISVPNIAWLPHRLNLLLGRLPRTADEIGWDGGHLHYFTFQATKDFLKESGFKICHQDTSGIFAPIKRIYPSLLGGDIFIVAQKE